MKPAKDFIAAQLAAAMPLIKDAGICNATIAVPDSKNSSEIASDIIQAFTGICFTPLQEAKTGLLNAKHFLQVATKSGALDDASIELIDQAEAIMQMVLDNLQKQELPPEFAYHLANVVNELQACTKLCTGNLQVAVFDLSAAVEKLRGDYE